MQLNSPAQLRTGRRLIQQYGSWDKVREASVYVDGVWLVVREPLDLEGEQRENPGMATETIITREIDRGFVGDGGSGCIEGVPCGILIGNRLWRAIVPEGWGGNG